MAIWENPQILSGNIPQAEDQTKKKIKVAICILHTGTVDVRWAMRTSLVFAQLQKKGIPFSYMLNSNQPYDTAREQLTRMALESGAEYIFHYDSDVLIPVNTIELLIEWIEKFNIPIMSGIYWAKKPQIMPAAWAKIAEHPEENRYDFAPMDLKKTIEKSPGKDPIVPMDVVGAGCLMIRRDVFEKLDKSNPDLPYFQWGIGRYNTCPKCKDKTPLPMMSEDFYFCMRAGNELNLKPHVATLIRCDHISSCVRRGSDGEFELNTGMT